MNTLPDFFSVNNTECGACGLLLTYSYEHDKDTVYIELVSIVGEQMMKLSCKRCGNFYYTGLYTNSKEKGIS